MIVWPVALAAACGSQPAPDARPPSPPPAIAAPTQSQEPVVQAPAPSDASAPAASTPLPDKPAPVPGFTGVPETHQRKFPGVRPPKARMFPLKPLASDTDKCVSIVGSDGHLCGRVIGLGVELPPVHIERVTDLLSDARGFKHTAPSCYEPQHALVFYNDSGVPLGWSEVSLGCGTVRAAPALTGIHNHEGVYVLAASGLSYLRGLCKTLKLEGCESR
jgi:hypothetical protein